MATTKTSQPKSTKGSAKGGTAKYADLAILKNSRITEKGANASMNNTYVFDVATTATKSEIAKAFEAVYKAKPLKINTVTMQRKSYFRRGKLGFGTKGKRAYVIIPKGVKVDIQ